MPRDVFADIDDLVARAERDIPQQTRKRKLKIYAEGLKAKIRQADFALLILAQYDTQTDVSRSSTEEHDFSVLDQVHFYCDTYWTFLYSALDVLGQVINQAVKLDLPEVGVSFRRVQKTLTVRQGGSVLQKKCTKCLKSDAYVNLDRYRNCSTHRRQIFIKEQVNLTNQTAGYGSSTPIPAVSMERTICDNPLKLRPSVHQDRRVPDYLQRTRSKIVDAVAIICQSVQPIR